MSIARRKDGRWLVKYKADGVWKQRSFRPDQEAEARKFDAECQYDSAENTRLTLFEAVVAYLRNHKLCQKNKEVYTFLICGHDWIDGTHREGPAEILADRFCDSLNRLDLETVRENCRRSASIGTVNAYVGKLKAALNWCVQEDLIKENPWAKYRNLLGVTHKTRAGTLEDFAKLYPVLPAWLQWASKTAIALCLRPGIAELFRLEWPAFRWREGSVEVRMPKVNSTKLVYPPEAYLEEAWQRYEADRLKGKTLVCRGRKDRAVTEGCYIIAWKRACKKAGIRMPMYALRHIAASEMLANGADLAAVAAQLGHKDITTTGAFYTHALASGQRRAALALPDCTKMMRNGAGIEARI